MEFEFEWSKEQTLRFIELVKETPVIWNFKHKDHYNKVQRQEGWEKIAQQIPVCASDLKKKWESLQASFRREKKKTLGDGTLSAADEEWLMESKWFAYDALSFLLQNNKRKPQITAESLQNMQCQSSPDASLLLQPQRVTVLHHKPSSTPSRGASLPLLFHGSFAHLLSPPDSGAKDTSKIMCSTPIPSKRKRIKTEEEKPPDDDCVILKTPACGSSDDEAQMFGNLVAMKLRNSEPLRRSYIQLQIMQLFHTEELKNYRPVQESFKKLHHASHSAAKVYRDHSYDVVTECVIPAAHDELQEVYTEKI